MIFFTSDHHFGHENIIKYTSRPFRDVENMDETMIHRWNEVVSDEDTVYHLGDFTLSDTVRADGYLRRLNGYIHVLSNWWHHDRRWLSEYGNAIIPKYSANGAWVMETPPIWVIEVPEYGGTYPLAIVMSHYPMAEWDRKHYGAWHLHGHSHGKHKADGLILDVGVDGHDFYPWSMVEVAEYMNGRRAKLPIEYYSAPR